MLFFGNTAQALSIKIGHNDTSYDGATAALFKVVFERSGYNVSEIKGGLRRTTFHAGSRRD